MKRVRFLRWGAALALLGCAGRPPGPGLAGLRLPTLGGPSTAVDACPAKRCLLIYVAPWCGYCRAATPMFLELREELKKRGVLARFIVGMDKLHAVKEYAATFGPDTFLDPSEKLPAGGVPHLYLMDSSARVIADAPGAPPNLDEALRWVLARQ